MLSTIRPQELSDSLADALNNGSDKFEGQTDNIKFFEWVKTRIFDNNREFLINLRGRRGRSHSPESETERRGSQDRRFSR
jgi:hypothetical protein